MLFNLSEVIESPDFNHCIYRDGFVFTCVDAPANVLDAIVIRNPKKCSCWSPKKSFSEKSLDEHVDFINKYKIKKACIIAENINFIKECPSLEFLEIRPADTAHNMFDYSPLYEMPKIKYLSCSTKYGGISEEKTTLIDYSKINGLEELNIDGNGHYKYEMVKSLRVLNIGNEQHHKDLKWLSTNYAIQKLMFVQPKIQTLNGIGELHNLQQFSIDYARSLCDISDLNRLSSSLRSLSIAGSPRITDFSCLEKLTELEHLELHGKNNLPNLSFLSNMKKLKTFSFSMNVLDCDLSLCLNVPYVNCVHNKKTYNFKDKDLPKNIPSEPFRIINN